jgi:hypothetical protein
VLCCCATADSVALQLLVLCLSAVVLLSCCVAPPCCVAECVDLYLLAFEGAFRRAGAAVVWLVLLCTCWHFEGAELSEG